MKNPPFRGLSHGFPVFFQKYLEKGTLIIGDDLHSAVPVFVDPVPESPSLGWSPGSELSLSEVKST